MALQHYLRRWMTVLGRRAEPMLGGIMICQYAVNAAIDDAVCKHGGRMAVRRSLFEQCQGTRRIAGPAGAGQHHLAERDLSVHHADLGRARDPSAPFRDIAVNASSLDQDAAIPELRVRHSVCGFAQPLRRLPVVARDANTTSQADGTIVSSYRITRCRRLLEPFVETDTIVLFPQPVSRRLPNSAHAGLSPAAVEMRNHCMPCSGSCGTPAPAK